MKKRVFFQGDRDISGEARKTAIEIMERLGELGWAANVGAYGELAAAICEAGVEVRSHGGYKDQPEKIDRSKFEYVDCSEMAKKLGHETKEMAWAIRLAILMETSDAFVFMPGREGTRAHLDPVIAFNAKGWDPKKKIALVGWCERDLRALFDYFHLTGEEPWIQTFPATSEGIEAVVKYLIS